MPIEASASASFAPSSQLASPGVPDLRVAVATAATTDGIDRRPVRLAAPSNAGLVLTPPSATSATVGEARFPRGLCQRRHCSVPMEIIWGRFVSAGRVDPATLPHVFSGKAYSLSGSSASANAHHGGLLLDRQPDGALTANVRWWLLGNNPYAETTLAEARQWTQPRYPVRDRGDHLFIDITQNNPWEDPVGYWVRQDPQSGTLYVIASFSNDEYVISEMKPNPATPPERPATP